MDSATGVPCAGVPVGASPGSPENAPLVKLPIRVGTGIPIVLRRHYGTIVVMIDHRVRLTDEDLALVVAALRARAAMAGPLRRHRVERLATRLAECSRGNPKYSLGEFEQTHEDELDSDDLDAS